MLQTKKAENQIIQLISILILLAILVITLLMLTFFKGQSTFEFAVLLSVISTITCVVLIKFNPKIPNLGVFSVLFIYFTITHFGASTIFFISPEIVYAKFLPHQYAWLHSNYTIIAILLSVVSQIVFILSAVAFSSKRESVKEYPIILENKSSIWIPRIGYICVLIVFLYLLFNILVGNISITSGYGEFKEWSTENNILIYALFLLATGYVMVLATGHQKQVLNVNILFVLIGIILFLTGNKGEVLYPAFAGLGVYYARYKKIRKKTILVFVLLFFLVIPFITSVRADSIVGSIDQVGLNIADPFLETGWQLRTVEKVVSWIEEGEKLGYGISYFAPMERIFSRLTFGVIPPIPILNVPWSFGERLPGWGFSQVAESYFNFSLFGPIIFYLLQGWFAVSAENQNVSQYRKAIYASIVVILMILTRNRFSFVPGQIFMVLLIILVCYFLDGKLKNSRFKLR